MDVNQYLEHTFLRWVFLRILLMTDTLEGDNLVLWPVRGSSWLLYAVRRSCQRFVKVFGIFSADNLP